VLGLSWPCTAAEVKAAYWRLSKKVHPDVGGSAEAFRRIDEAYKQFDSIVRPRGSL
jgi:curved DNA-binding protein CbpA